MSRLALCTVVLALASSAGCLIHLKRKPAHAIPAEEGELGPLHAAHPDEIVFAAAAIPRDGGLDVALARQLRADQPIWARAFLSRSIARSIATVPDPHHNCQWDSRHDLSVLVGVDGGPLKLLSHANAGQKTWSSYHSMLLGDAPAPLVATEAILPQHVRHLEARALLLLAGLPDGTHTLTIEQEASCLGESKVVVSKGTLEVVVDAAARANLVKRIRLASALMREPAEVARLTKAAAATFDQTTLVDFRVLDDTWIVERSPEGTPLSRHVTGLTYYRQGNQCTLVGSKIVEEHLGGGTYGAPRFLDVSMTDPRLAEHEVPCGIDTTR
jgi:hypothetical protein